MTPVVAICQLNDQPEDEQEFDMEIVILEGKELVVLKWKKDPSEVGFNFEGMTASVTVLGFDVVTDWECLDGRAFAVVQRRAA
jgi:hypothetical protein